MYELLKAEWREGRKVAPVKSIRAKGFVPGVIFGKGIESINFKVDKMHLSKFLHNSGKVFEVEVSGKGKHLVNIDAIQMSSLGDSMMHVSFHKLSASEKTIVTLPIHMTGTAVGAKEGGVVNQVLNEVEVKGLPKDMPEYIEVDISGLDLNGHIALKSVSLPRGLEWVHDQEGNVVSCHIPRIQMVESAVEAVAEEIQVEEIKEAS